MRIDDNLKITILKTFGTKTDERFRKSPWWTLPKLLMVWFSCRAC